MQFSIFGHPSAPASRQRFQSALVAVGSVVLLLTAVSCKDLPQPAPTYDLRVLDQGWTAAERQAYYHTAQGTQILPYDWFMALEQALSTKLFRANDHVARYRFLPDLSTLDNPDRLPVGMVKDVNEVTKKPYLGLTCAACHSGQLNYGGMGIRIDGGEGTLDLTSFIEEMFQALAITELDPLKFDRFAHRVLGDHYTAAAKRALHEEVKEQIREVSAIQKTAKKRGLYPTPDGFGRQDALGRGGNNGFGKLGIEANLAVADAPVSYPAVWNGLNWDWVQYNGSIHQPMGRNIGEVLGVGAVATLKGNSNDLYQSSVKILNLHALETLVGKLQPPAWPEDILGPINHDQAKRGADLFKARCAGCHEPRWDETKHLFKIRLIPLEEIGTDPNQATNLKNHKIDTGDLGFGVISAGEALQLVTEKIAQRKYQELGIGPDEQSKMNQGRENLFAANLAYRAHSLTSVWATPPYLHNGSVPNLYELLSPVEERSKTFFTGNLEFDPVLIGYEKDPIHGGFRFDTSLAGNSNAGHEFRDGPKKQGVLGAKLTPEQRMDLIEYLKTR